jgi:hypothetical protein
MKTAFKKNMIDEAVDWFKKPGNADCILAPGAY